MGLVSTNSISHQKSEFKLELKLLVCFSGQFIYCLEINYRYFIRLELNNIETTETDSSMEATDHSDGLLSIEPVGDGCF